MAKQYNRRIVFFFWAFLLLAAAPAVCGVSGSDVGELSDVVRAAEAHGVPQTTVNRVLTLCYENGVQPKETARLLASLTEAHKEGMPLGPFVSKLEEGLTKKVPAAKIEKVLNRKLEDYRFTKSLAVKLEKRSGRESDYAENYVVRLTETLYCGLSREDLKEITSHPHTTLAEATRAAETVAAFLQMGVDHKLCREIASSGLKHNYFETERHDFIRTVAIAKRKGMSDSKITAAASRLVAGKLSYDQFREHLNVTEKELTHFGPQPAQSHMDGGQRRGLSAHKEKGFDSHGSGTGGRHEGSVGDHGQSGGTGEGCGEGSGGGPGGGGGDSGGGGGGSGGAGGGGGCR